MKLDDKLVSYYAWRDSRLARFRWWVNSPTRYETWLRGRLVARQAARELRAATVTPAQRARARAAATLVMVAAGAVAVAVLLWPAPAQPVDHFPGWDRMPAPTVPSTPSDGPVAV